MKIQEHTNIARDAWEVFMQLCQAHTFCMQHTLQKYGLYEGQPAFLFQIRDMATPAKMTCAGASGKQGVRRRFLAQA
jgi:hypothetical protein